MSFQLDNVSPPREKGIRLNWPERADRAILDAPRSQDVLDRSSFPDSRRRTMKKITTCSSANDYDEDIDFFSPSLSLSLP